MEEAIEKLDTLITESQSQAKPFEFDEQIHEVGFPATMKNGKKRTVYHRLRKPTLKELNEREGQIQRETTKLNARETEIRSNQSTADTNLWYKVIVAVKGYDRGEEWRGLSDAEKEGFNSAHK